MNFTKPKKRNAEHLQVASVVPLSTNFCPIVETLKEIYEGKAVVQFPGDQHHMPSYEELMRMLNPNMFKPIEPFKYVKKQQLQSSDSVNGIPNQNQTHPSQHHEYGKRTVQVDTAKASMVDDLQNKNQDLFKQIEICQEENEILDKMHRQKVAEAVLAGGAAVNAVRDYQQKFQKMMRKGKRLIGNWHVQR